MDNLNNLYDRLPPGWRYERVSGSLTCFTIAATGNAGYVTIEFGKDAASRGFRGGLGNASGAYILKTETYSGRGWSARLAEDAVAWLTGVINLPRAS